MICMKCLSPAPDDVGTCPKCGAQLRALQAGGFSKRLRIDHDWKGKRAEQNSASTDSKSAEEVKEPDSLVGWLKSELKKSILMIPKRIKTLAIYAGIILAVNLIFWTIKPYFLPVWLQPFRKAISVVIFMTATYNDVIPKTIFWVIVFTFGKKLFNSMRKKGFKASFRCMKKVVPNFVSSFGRLKNSAYPVLLIGAGIGLVIANNFASYSRFSGARNKFDKYFVVLVIAFTISYLLGEAKKTGLFKFIKLGTKDIARLARKKQGLSDDSVYILLSSFVMGLLLDAPLIYFKVMYGGYICGAVAVLAGIGVILFEVFKNKTEVKSQ